MNESAPRRPTLIAAPRSGYARANGRGARGSVLVVVLVTLLFATTALMLFIDRASSDLLVAARDADSDRLRLEAHSAMETVLAVLEDFRIVNGGLHSPAEGWAEPLEWAGYEPESGRTVEVAFVDESGKLSLPRADFEVLRAFFENEGLREPEAKELADALLGWMQKDYTPQTATAPRERDYENAEFPFRPPGRPLRSFAELRSIDLVRERFFDETGQVTRLGRAFMEAVSLYDFEQPNINSAPPGVLAAVARYDEAQQRQLMDFRQGLGAHRNSRRFFQSAGEVAGVLGEQGVSSGFGAEIVALRVMVTVREGPSNYRLEAVIAPPGGATLVPGPAIPETEDEADEPEAREERNEQASANTGDDSDETGEAGQGLQYPFTLLEIRENAAIPSEPMEAPAHLLPPNQNRS